MVEFYWSLGAEIKIQSILRGAVPVCSSDRGPRSQLMEVRTVVFTHESQLHPWPLSMFLSVQGDTVNCCDRLPIDDIIELDIRLGENDCIYIYIMSVTPPWDTLPDRNVDTHLSWHIPGHVVRQMCYREIQYIILLYYMFFWQLLWHFSWHIF